ncbi:MAG: DUF1570 domain-containing protein [Thermoguttaceae bacterium]|nr:DUF1570 domain-containing protein [Thermoguttaceae bacterium]
METLEFRQDERTIQGEGRVLIEDSEGGVLFEMTDGQRYIINAESILSRSKDTRPFKAITPEVVAARVMKELPDGFSLFKTAHYSIVYNTTTDYAKWCGGTLEQLYRAFSNFWKGKEIELTEPEFPLIVVIFSQRGDYVKASRAELGDAVTDVLGFYSMNTNRITTFDSADTQAYANERGRINMRQVNEMPGMSENVRNLVHEATHQLSFNTGMLHRFYAVPRWFAEGMSCYFEVPDPGSSKGWGKLGEPNPIRTQRFANMIHRRTDGTLELIEKEEAMLMTDTALDSYAEAYSMFFYMVKQKPRDLKKYVTLLAAKQSEGTMEQTSAERLNDFESAFGAKDSFYDSMRKYWIRFLK